MINVTIVKVLELIFYPFIAFVIGIILMGLFRKIMARIQRRYGPPLLQPLIDIIRFFSQRTVSHGKIFSLGVIFIAMLKIESPRNDKMTFFDRMFLNVCIIFLLKTVSAMKLTPNNAIKISCRLLG